MVRRAFPSIAVVWLLAIGIDVAGAATSPASRPAGVVPASGRIDPRMAPFDELMAAFVAENEVPGAVLAVGRGGRVVYERGFGHVDVGTRVAVVAPDALFRIASVSKPITAVAVLQLVERGKLKLDDKVVDLLKVEPLAAGAAAGGAVDPRWGRVTVRQLLQHSGGFDRGKSFDPMFRSVEIAKAAGHAPPAMQGDIIRYMLGRPLDFEPGTREVYSNFGYCVLGRIIERVSGVGYEAYVREQVLAPLGITRMRLGRTLAADRAEGEVMYRAANGRPGKAVMGEKVGAEVPQPYGAWCLEAMDAHGGWIASAGDLVRFATAFDKPEECPILSAKSIALMFERPAGALGVGADGKPKAAYYACGWMVRPVGAAGNVNTWHSGRLPGTGTLVVRRHDGYCWAVLFNTEANARGQDLTGLIDPLLHRAADRQILWV